MTDHDDDAELPDAVMPPAADGSVDAGLGSMGLDLGNMMEMAAGMQQQMQAAQAELAAAEVTGSAGGGVVSVVLNGHLHLRSVSIDPSAIDADDPSMVEDLIVAAWQDAHDQVARLQAAADPLGGIGGALGADLGGLGGLFGGG